VNAASPAYRATTYELIQAIRGPIMLITLGVLVALDYFQGLSFSRRTWPLLLIVFGLLKLLEKAGRPPIDPGPYSNPSAVPPGGTTI
jgi:Domain of unknown function (DUF5668)